MFERYTEAARRTLFYARYNASQAKSASIEPHHLLLGLIRDAQGGAARIFAESSVSLPEVFAAIDAIPLPRKGLLATLLPGSGEIPFTAETKEALQAASEEADRLGHTYIGSEHLLLGLLRIEGSEAAKLLAAKGLSLDTARKAISPHAPGQAPIPEP